MFRRGRNQGLLIQGRVEWEVGAGEQLTISRMLMDERGDEWKELVYWEGKRRRPQELGELQDSIEGGGQG